MKIINILVLIAGIIAFSLTELIVSLIAVAILAGLVYGTINAVKWKNRFWNGALSTFTLLLCLQWAMNGIVQPSTPLDKYIYTIEFAAITLLVGELSTNSINFLLRGKK
jgi:hypothetical protein